MSAYKLKTLINELFPGKTGKIHTYPEFDSKINIKK